MRRAGGASRRASFEVGACQQSFAVGVPPHRRAIVLARRRATSLKAWRRELPPRRHPPHRADAYNVGADGSPPSPIAGVLGPPWLPKRDPHLDECRLSRIVGCRRRQAKSRKKEFAERKKYIYIYSTVLDRLPHIRQQQRGSVLPEMLDKICPQALVLPRVSRAHPSQQTAKKRPLRQIFNRHSLR